VNLGDASRSISGPMTEEPAGSRTFVASVSIPFGGTSEVRIAIAGCDPIEFNVYIDPSGFVRDTKGDPIVGATVTLMRSESPLGPFDVVPDGSAIMSPSNRTNSDLTDETGHFGWDVIAGYYKVQVFKAGCVSAADPSRGFAETVVYEIPPPVTDIDLRLNCGETSTVPGSDEEAPTIEIGSPQERDALLLGATIDYTCEDNVGIAGCALLVDGVEVATDAAATSTVGSHSLEVVATDAAGNETRETRSYTVVYEFSGFFAPIDNLDGEGRPIYNRTKGGSAVAIKFSLAGDQGLDVLGGGLPSSAQVSCDGSATQDTIEETVSASGGGLKYDGATDQYSFVFKTDKRWAGTCRVLNVRLDDDTLHRIFFRFP
jgi:hypothetical protein